MAIFDSMEALLREMKQAPSIVMPEFDASNVSDWLLKVDRSFRVCRYSDLDKLDLVAFSLEGYVLQWFSWEMSYNEIRSWDEFRSRLLLKFGAASEESSENVAEILEKKESKKEVDLSMEKIASQLKLPNTKVHVSDSENLRNIETRIENSVLDNSESVVKEAKIQKNIRVDVVNDSKNVSAHQVLDKMCQLKRLKPQNKRELRLSLKTWKFKFKNKNLQHNWSQRDLLQVIDSSKINNLYLCFGANFGLVRKHRTFQCLRLKKQAHKSRVQYHLRRLHDPRGKKDELFDEIFETGVDIGKVQRTQMDTVAESHSDVASSTDVITKGQTPACAVVIYSEPATSAHVMQTADWDEACGAEIGALKGTGTCIVTSLPARCGWLVFDRGKHGQIQWTEIQTISLYKAMVADPVKQAVLNLVTNAARFGFVSVLSQTPAVHLDVKPDYMQNQVLPQSHKFKVDKFGRLNTTRLTVLRVLCLSSTLFWSTSFKKQKFGKNWWYKFKHSLWQRECGRDLLEEDVLVPVTVVTVRYEDVLLLILGCFRQTLFVSFYPFTLEVKRHFNGGSIDTFGQEEE